MNKNEIMEAVEEGGVHFTAIFEMVGKPKEHVEKAFNDYIDSLKKDSSFTIVESDVAEVSEVEESDSLFSTFCEMEVVSRSFSQVYDFCFKYMPASIEIIDPSDLDISASDATGLINDFIAKMHERDMDTKKANQTMRLLTQNINILVENLTMLALRFKPMKVEEVAKATGVDKEKIPLFLEKLVKENKVSEKDGTYTFLKE